MERFFPVFVVIGILNAISAIFNGTFLYISRDYLAATQRLTPWILGSAILQSFRCIVMAAMGETELSTIIYDTCSSITVFLGTTYFIFYVLILVKQAHLLVNKELPTKFLYTYYVMHFLLIPFGIMDIIVKNIVRNNQISGVKYAYYFFVMGVVLFLVDYSGIKVIRFAEFNAKIIRSSGMQTPEANLNPLKKTLMLFTAVCLAGCGAFGTQMVIALKSPTPFPNRVFGAFDMFLIVLLGLANFVTALHAWIHLDRCKRKTGGRDSQKTIPSGKTKVSRNSLHVPSPTARMSQSTPSVSKTESGITQSTGVPTSQVQEVQLVHSESVVQDVVQPVHSENVALDVELVASDTSVS